MFPISRQQPQVYEERQQKVSYFSD